jgi:hypothetical protein
VVRSLFAVVALASSAAYAARTEIAPIPGQARLFYDSDARKLGVEMENYDRLWITRHGYDGRALGTFMLEPFEEGDDKGIDILTKAGAAFTGTTSLANEVYLPRGNKLVCLPLGAGQTLPPDMTATGLDISGDEVADEGYECVSHVLGATGAPLTIGTTPAFYFLVEINVADVSGSDDLQCGLRKLEAVEAGVDDYTDFVSLGWNTAADPAAIKIETANDNAATTTTDTTDTIADGVSLQLKFFVSGAGVVTYLHDADTLGTLEAPDAVAAYTFDDGDLVHPFCRTLQDTGLTGAVELRHWEVGLQ